MPEWPLSAASDRELLLWAGEWRRPQAVMWERAGQHLEVGLHVRTFVRAEDPTASSALVTLVRQQAEALGISTPGMLRNRWRLGQVDVGADEVEDEDDPRNRLTVVAGGAA